MARELSELNIGDNVLLILEGDDSVSTNVENWREFQKKFWYLNVDLAVGMPAGDITNAPEGIWTDGGELWSHRRWAVFGLPEILNASVEENSTDL